MDDEFPLLSEEASAALLEVFTNATHYGELATSDTDFTEDWRLSQVKFQHYFTNSAHICLVQFWYTEHTADVVCSEIETHLKDGSIACVSCPTIFRRFNTRLRSFVLLTTLMKDITGVHDSRGSCLSTINDSLLSGISSITTTTNHKRSWKNIIIHSTLSLLIHLT